MSRRVAGGDTWRVLVSKWWLLDWQRGDDAASARRTSDDAGQHCTIAPCQHRLEGAPGRREQGTATGVDPGRLTVGARGRRRSGAASQRHTHADESQPDAKDDGGEEARLSFHLMKQRRY